MLKFNQIKPGMVFLTRGFGEIIIVLSVGVFNNWLHIICITGNDIFNMYGLPENEFPHNLLQPD